LKNPEHFFIRVGNQEVWFHQSDYKVPSGAAGHVAYWQVADFDFDYGEERFVTFGLLQGHVVAVVHTESEDYIRIISARKATKYEQKTYFEKI
jgi:uncharacterized protein